MNQSLKASQSETCPAIAVVVFGLGDGDKPQAARFPEKLGNLAIKAAEQLKLNVLKVTTDEVAKIAAQLPVGRINANGRGFIPYVRQDLYQKLTELAGTVQPAPAPGLPRSWNEIDVGHMVLAREEGVDEGWFEAIVLAKDDDMLTLKWRDYPKQENAVRHRAALALLKPTAG
jgi:hypothetical protein